MGLALTHIGLSAQPALLTVTIEHGSAVDETGVNTITVSTPITISTQASGAAGVDTGTIAAGEYWVWLIANAGNTVVSGILSLSRSAPTMPATYTLKRRIARVTSTGAGVITIPDLDSVSDGAISDPESVAAADAETDGRIYGMVVPSISGFDFTWVSSGTAINTNYFAHAGADNNNHNGSFAPGGAFPVTHQRATLHNGSTIALAESGTLRSGAYLARGVPDAVVATGVDAGACVGSYRGWRYAKQLINGQTFRAGGVDKAYFIGRNWAAVGEGVCLLTGL